ncbi:MAG: creatininase family protein [Thermoplasmatota archaeon]
MRVLWEENDWMTIRDSLDRGAPVILPCGCVEEHGPHLPVGTDLFQAYHVALQVAARTDGMVLPPFHYGHSSSTRNFPGSIVISAGTLRSMTKDVLEGVVSSGARKILILTGHAGSTHMAVMRDAAREVVENHEEVIIYYLTDYEIAAELIRKDPRFPPADGHAGDIETSRMMDIYPELVGKPPEGSFPRFPPHRILPDPESYFPTGLMGDPENADPGKGAFLNDRIVEYLVDLLSGD